MDTRTKEENDKIKSLSLPASSMHFLGEDFPSLAMRRQRKYWQATAPVQPVIVSRSDSDMVKQDWYFSCGENSVFLSGYRRYGLDAAGNCFIAARWYPEVHALDNLIPIEEVPFPDDVVKEAIEKGYDRALPEGFQVSRNGQHVMVMVGTGLHPYQETMLAGMAMAAEGCQFRPTDRCNGKQLE